jgi:hypothetical protein
VGRKLLKPSGNKTISWGDRQVNRIKLAAAFTSWVAFSATLLQVIWMILLKWAGTRRPV